MIRILGLVLMGEEELLQMIHTTISYLKTECDLKDREIAALRLRRKEVVSE
jgi:hypothetical protein